MLDLVLDGLLQVVVVQGQAPLLQVAMVGVLRLVVAALGVLVASVLGVAVAWVAARAARALTQARMRWSRQSRPTIR